MFGLINAADAQRLSSKLARQAEKILTKKIVAKAKQGDLHLTLMRNVDEDVLYDYCISEGGKAELESLGYKVVASTYDYEGTVTISWKGLSGKISHD